MELDAQDPGGLLDLPGHPAVGLTGCGVAARVVVHKEEATGSVPDYGQKDLGGGDRAPGATSLGHEMPVNDSKASRHGDDPELL